MRAGTEKWRPDAEKVNARQGVIPAGRFRFTAGRRCPLATAPGGRGHASHRPRSPPVEWKAPGKDSLAIRGRDLIVKVWQICHTFSSWRAARSLTAMAQQKARGCVAPAPPGVTLPFEGGYGDSNRPRPVSAAPRSELLPGASSFSPSDSGPPVTNQRVSPPLHSLSKCESFSDQAHLSSVRPLLRLSVSRRFGTRPLGVPTCGAVGPTPRRITAGRSTSSSWRSARRAGSTRNEQGRQLPTASPDACRPES
jgi:hypothetical protein